jgi:hypothetical protein
MLVCNGGKEKKFGRRRKTGKLSIEATYVGSDTGNALAQDSRQWDGAMTLMSGKIDPVHQTTELMAWCITVQNPVGVSRQFELDMLRKPLLM